MSVRPVIDIISGPIDWAEAIDELTQDGNIAGYQNLGQSAVSLNSGAPDPAVTIHASQSQFINGQGGDDTITIIGKTDDIIYGGSGNDQINAGAGNDQVYGGSGADILFGGSGNDTLSGGSGNDILVGDGFSGSGESGNDILNGGTGDDRLVGGLGTDTLTGGYGADQFAFLNGLGNLNESKVGQGDVITDFEVNVDKIDLSSIDADGNGANGNQAFQFTSGPSADHGTVWIVKEADGQHIFANIDGGAPDVEIIVHSVNNAGLTAHDFML